MHLVIKYGHGYLNVPLAHLGAGELREILFELSPQKVDGRTARTRAQSGPLQTRWGAEQYERDLRQELLCDKYGVSVKKVPTLRDLEQHFLTYAENNTKPSAVHAKRGTLKRHLGPAFGAIGARKTRHVTIGANCQTALPRASQIHDGRPPHRSIDANPDGQGAPCQTP